MKKLASLLIAALLLAGCATSEIGRPIDYAAAQKIEIGKTTKAEVRAWLGEPMKQRESADGTSAFMYAHIKGHAQSYLIYVKGTAEGEKVIIKFDKAGIVQAIEKAKIQK